MLRKAQQRISCSTVLHNDDDIYDANDDDDDDDDSSSNNKDDKNINNETTTALTTAHIRRSIRFSYISILVIMLMMIRYS